VKKEIWKMRNNRISTVLLFLVLYCCLFLKPRCLEARTYTVFNIFDTGIGSLRAAIDSANNNVGQDTIDFKIPGVGVKTIRPLSQLPPLIDEAGVLLDGFTQGGGVASPGVNPPLTANLLVELNGSTAGLSHGIWIVSPNNTIQGMIIDSFEQDGIRIQASKEVTFNNLIYCNFIGTDPTGTIARGNGRNRINLWAGINIVVPPGDTTYINNNIVLGNLSSGNYAEGISISGCPPGDNHSNVVSKNYLGTDFAGMSSLGNAHNGVYIGGAAHDNLVDSNLISANGTEGVSIIGYADEGQDVYWYATSNTVSNNIIGLNANQTLPMGNKREGISIGVYYGNAAPVWRVGYATGNIIGPNNIIAHNGRSGVIVREHSSSNSNSDRNQITRNSIYDNGLLDPGFLGIDLSDDGITLNDLSDPDNGANQELNFPVIESAYVTGQTAIYGRIDVDSDPTQATVEVFRAKTDPSLYGEGQVYLGSVSPDASGNWNIVVSGLAAGYSVTATTTDMSLNTSEFCDDYVVIAGTGVGEAGDTIGNSLEISSPLLINYVEINFNIKKREKIKLDIYDLSGKFIINLVDKVCEPSSYSASWDGKNIKGESVPAGIYICTLESVSGKVAKKILKIQ
jgi:hypothetical protein